MTCPICGVRYCALFSTTNAAALADWRRTHVVKRPANPAPAADPGGER